MPSDGVGATSGGAKPLAIFPAALNELGAVNALFCLTGKLKAYLSSGKEASMLMP